MIQIILGYCDVKVTGLHSSNINIYSLLKKGDCVNHVDMWFVPKKPPATIDFTYYQTIFIVGIRTKTYNNKFHNWYTSIHHNYNISILCFTFATYKFPCKGAKDYTISSKWNDNPFTVITKGTLIFQRLPVKQCNNIPEIMHTLEKPLMANTVRMEIPTYYDDGSSLQYFFIDTEWYEFIPWNAETQKGCLTHFVMWITFTMFWPHINQ